jgi:hypothetical protein
VRETTKTEPDMTRRTALLSALALTLAGLGGAEARPGPAQRRRRRRMRRRIRRRIRRRVAFRMRAGRRFLVVPVAMAAGWELAIGNQVSVVKEVRPAQGGVEMAVVQYPDGKTQEVALAREDTPENTAEMEGTQLPEGDTTTPAVEAEVEVEVEE